MMSTEGYLNAPEHMRKHREASSGAIKVVAESYTDDECSPWEKVSVYVSFDNGKTFTLLAWGMSWANRLKAFLQGRHWPPRSDVAIKAVDSSGLVVTYVETGSMYERSMVRQAVYSFAEKRWRV